MNSNDIIKLAEFYNWLRFLEEFVPVPYTLEYWMWYQERVILNGGTR